MKPKLFLTLKSETNAIEVVLEDLHLPPEGLEVVIVTSKEMKTVTLHNGDTLNVTPNGK